MSAAREVQAHLLRALAAGGDRLDRAACARLAPGQSGRAACADLVAAGLVLPDGSGGLVAGPRGSRLDARDVEARLTTRELGWPVEIHAVLASSNDVVLERATAGAATGLVVGAELQTAARGRRGRVFDARPGLGLWTTTLLPPPGDPGNAPRLSLLAALATAEAIEEAAGVAATVKWPNDVRIAGRKVAGVLVEARSRGRVLHAVAGIGVNVHHRPGEFPPELAETAISVETAAGRPVARGVLLAALLGRLESWVSRDAAGEVHLPSAWAVRDELAGRDVLVETDGRRIEGHGEGVAEDGSLKLVVPAEGTLLLRAGETRVRSAA